MYKRVTKRERKKRDEEKRGITAEMKELIGMGDTDSDESSESSESEQETEHTIPSGPHSRKRKRYEDEDDNSEDGSSVLEKENDGMASLESTDEQDGDDGPLSGLSVKEALKLPVQDGNCVICPGKVFKNPFMENTHIESAHHKRRLKRFRALVETLVPDIYSGSASMLVHRMDKEKLEKESQQASNGQSNRAKKREKYEKQKEKRKVRRLKKKNAADSTEKATKVTAQPRKKKKRDNTSAKS
ncbi:hypothetical protein FRC19_003328 [Serendipita sp. 401]|nr:hypothetical protein FRC19_003328 [Serendipita sp. 401]